MIPSRCRVVGLTAASLIPLCCANLGRALPSPVSQEAAGLVVIHNPDEAPAGATHFGSEFWRQTTSSSETASSLVSLQSLTTVRVGDAIERVSHAFCAAPDGTAALVRAQGYHATVSAGGLDFMPEPPLVAAGSHPGARFDLAASARFRTRRIAAGSRELFNEHSGAPSWYITGNTAQALLGSGLTEFYEARPDGIEVTWLLSQPLPTKGDLVIRA